MEAVTDDGVVLWFDDAGDGRAVLLLPGRGDSSDLFPAMFTGLLVDGGLRVLRLDPRDTGLSGDGGDRYTVRTMAADAVAVLDAAGVEQAHVVAVSMSGMVAVHLATGHPTRVSSLTLVAAMSPDPDAGMGEDFFAAFDADPLAVIVAAMGDADEGDREWAAEELARAAARAPARPDAVARHQAAAFRWEWPELPDLARIGVPVTVVHGTHDRVLPVAHAEAFGRGVAGARVVLRDGMGHLPRRDDWRAIAQLVVEMADPRSVA